MAPLVINQSAFSPYNLLITNLLGTAGPLTSAVTLTTPSSATLITGLTAFITIPSGAVFIKVEVVGKGVTISAAATITQGAYTGSTSGALTTLFGTQVRLGATGGTVCDLNGEYYLPVTPSLYNTSTWISIAATASSGNYVTQASATEPTYMIITYL